MGLNSYDTFDELWLDAATQIRDEGTYVGSRDGETLEILGYVARLNDIRANFMFNPERNLSASYAAAEVLWYLSGTPSIEMIKEYAPQYERFAEDGIAWGAYGHRWMFKKHSVYKGRSQLDLICQLLRDKLETRQAVVVMWNAGDLPHTIAGDKKDIPCTLSMNFIVRNKELNLVVTMRSNDIWLGLPYDVFAFTTIQQLLARSLGLEFGWYQHQAMSLHVYQRDHQKFDKAGGVSVFNTGAINYEEGGEEQYLFDEKIMEALRIERWNRENKVCTSHLDAIGEWSTLGQLIVMTSSKFDDYSKWSKRIGCDLMKKHMLKGKK